MDSSTDHPLDNTSIYDRTVKLYSSIDNVSNLVNWYNEEILKREIVEGAFGIKFYLSKRELNRYYDR